MNGRAILGVVLGVGLGWACGNGTGPSAVEVERVAFISTRDPAGDAIYRVDADGSNLELACAIEGSRIWEFYPSPTGSRWVLKVSYPPDPVTALVTMRPDGTDARELPQFAGAGVYWSPEGARVAWTVRTGDSGVGIIVSDPLGNQATSPIGGNDETTNQRPSWAPDGSKLVFERRVDYYGQPDLYVVDADGSGMRRLAQADAHRRLPSWSPDGKTIAFEGPVPALSLIDADGSNERVLVNFITLMGPPAWSPDSRSLIVERHSPTSGATDLVRVDVATGAETVLLLTGSANATNLAWSASGDKVVFERSLNATGGAEVYVLDSNGGMPVNVSNDPGQAKQPAWESQ